MKVTRRAVLALAVFGSLVALPQLSQSKADAQSRPVELTLVSYAVAKPVFEKLIPEFQKEWKAKTGQTVTFKESYGASGAQTRAILGGLEADILAQNITSNVTPLVDKGLVRSNWNQRLPNNASPATTVMGIIVRPGNPKKIQTWADLARPGVSLVSLNPKTSGNARWGILAGYGSVLKAQGANSARTFLFNFAKNITTQVNSGREATDAFVKNRVGDALINFENEIIVTNDAVPRDFPYIVPSANVRVDFPVTVIDTVVDKRGTRRVAEAFTQFLFTPKAQAIYAEAGYRPFDRQVFQRYSKQFKPVKQLRTIADFGGWPTIDKTLYADGALFDQAQRAAR
ncbi:sulfate ABC transporter substrate-binding protein [Synechococcus elongatus]|uniref:sulfate ABC transporter substrate-binding protein n=1 Tax=Synechococcus elongatus TaxID=32046 RepID=UPI0030CB2DD5